MVAGDGFTAAELASLREASEAWMPDTALIVRNAGTINAIGGRTQGWGTIGTVDCRLRPFGQGSNGVEDERQSVIVADGEWEVVVPHGTDVTVEDRIEVGGATYEVTAHDGPRSDGADVRCQCVRRD